MKAALIVLVLSCVCFAFTMLFRRIIGLDVNLVALVVASIVFGSLFYGFGVFVRRKKLKGGRQKGSGSL